MSEGMVRLRTFGLSLASACLALTVFVATPSLAQLGQAEDTAERATTEGAASQDRINSLDDQAEELLRDYRAVTTQLDDMREYNAQQERLINAQIAEISSLENQIENVTGLRRDVSPLIMRMLDGLRIFVELDVPFLSTERNDRVARLTELMGRPDISPAEKFRRVLEAYQIENDYGRTIEAYSGSLGEGEQNLEVDFLKIGRVAFFYQTRDQNRSAIWNADTDQWDELPDRFNGPVRTGISMANEIIPPEILILPVNISTEEIE